jgi:hypothetical protein
VINPEQDQARDHDRRRRTDPAYRGAERRRAAGVPPSEFSAPAKTGKVARRLLLHTGNPLSSPRVLLKQLQSEFVYVEADEAAGREHVQRLLQHLRAGQGGRRHASYEQHIERLESVKDRAIFVYFGDDPASEFACLSTVLIPGEPLVFDFESAEHELQARNLLRRCAGVIGCDIALERRDDPIP